MNFTMTKKWPLLILSQTLTIPFYLWLNAFAILQPENSEGKCRTQ